MSAAFWRTTFALVLLALASGWPARAQCTTLSGLTYGTYVDKNGQTQPLLLDLMLPSGASTPLPLVIWIHGGGWSSGSRTPIPGGPTGLCSLGYAVASVDYRFAPAYPWPAQIQDVKGAVRWLRANAAAYNLDPDRFGAWGASAGGHLAAMLGTTGGLATVILGNLTIDLEGTVGGNTGVSSRVQAVADWYGATDFLQMRFYPATVNHDAPTSDESHLVGGPIQQHAEMVASADPITYVSAEDPPFLVMHGSIDDLIPFNQSELLVDALRAASVPVTFTPVPNIGHGGSSWETSANYQPVDDFFDARLKSLGAARVGVTAAADAAEAGQVPGRFTVTRSGSTAAPLTVRWALAGTAALGADYAAPASAAIIPAGASSLDVTVTPVDDVLVEGDETVELRLAADPAYRIDSAHASAVLTLADDDSPSGLPVVTLAATAADASEAGPVAGVLTVNAAGASGDLTVRYTVSGTAKNGADYAPLSGTLILPAGQTSATLEIDPVADGIPEAAETVFVTLAPSSSYAIGSPATAGVVIADADDTTATPVVSVAATDPTAAEPGGSSNNGAFTLTRTGSTASSLSVNLQFGGSAQNGGDYGFMQAFRTFPAGTTSLVLTISTLDDPDVEGPEDVTLTVLPSAALQAGPYTGARVVIQDNEPSTGLDGLYALTPCRLADTRRPAGPSGAPALSAGETRVFPASGVCGIPPEATALAINVTSVNPSSDGYLTLFQPGAPLPVASTVNLRTGLIRGNNGIFPLLGHPGGLAVYAGIPNGAVDVVIDVNGYFR